MLAWITGYAAALVVFIAGDLTWLSLTAPRFYRPVIGPLLADKPDLRPAVVFYLIYAVGIAVFAIAPGLKAGRPLAALGWGVLFGLVAYATYDLTNQATLRLWSTRLSLIDMACGAAITGIAAFAGCLAARMLNAR